VFDRYHIVSPGDLQDVARKLAGTFQGTSRDDRPVKPFLDVTEAGIVEPFMM
jgi:hypothetical protein